jgi:predicted NAD/FAD-dependent oxidoreductase
MTSTLPCIIIGAGIAGLMAAQTLHRQGIPCLVLEKSKGVGGRMATRRMGEALLDHGAQYFTAKTPIFQEWVKSAMHQGILTPWGEDQPTRFIGTTGMTQFPKQLAKGLAVRLNTQVTRLQQKDLNWLLTDQDGNTFRAETVLITAPLPQAMALVRTFHVNLSMDERNYLESIQYLPCLAYLGVSDQPSRIPPPGGLSLEDPVLAWVADNQQKGISPNQSAITLHGTAPFSREYYEAPDVEVAEVMTRAASQWMPKGGCQSWQIKRWRYAQPTHTFKEPFWVADNCPPLVVAGDAFGGPRVEGAAVSGLLAANWLVSSLSLTERAACG